MMEKIVYEPNIPVRLETLQIEDYPLHYHRDLQIVYVLEGEINLQLTFATYLLKKNDIHFVHSEDVHGFRSCGMRNKVMVLSIDLNFIAEFFPNIATQIFTTKIDESLLLYYKQQLELKACFLSIARELIKQNSGYQQRIQFIARNLIALLYKDFRSFAINPDTRYFEHTSFNDPVQMDRISEIITEIYLHYTEKISFNEIADKKHMNKYYLSHLFKKATGLSFREFVSMVRVETSEVNILSTSHSINRIALECGFSNQAYFTEHFQRWFKMKPVVYRERYCKEILGRKETQCDYFSNEETEILINKNLKFMSDYGIRVDELAVSKQELDFRQIHFSPWKEKRWKLVWRNPDLIADDELQQRIKQSFILFTEKSEVDSLVKACVHLEEPGIVEGSRKEYSQSKGNKYMTTIFSQLEAGGQISLYDPQKEICLLNDEGLRTPLFYFLRFLDFSFTKWYRNKNLLILKRGEHYRIIAENLQSSTPVELYILPPSDEPLRMIKETLNVERNCIHYRERLKKSQITEDEKEIIDRMTLPEIEMYTIKGKIAEERVHIPAGCILSLDIQVIQ